MEKIYRVQLNSKGMPNFATAVEIADRPQGEWIEVCKRTEQYDREGEKTWAVIYQCPTCGFVLNAIENHTAQYRYCPNCGCRMKGADDED